MFFFRSGSLSYLIIIIIFFFPPSTFSGTHVRTKRTSSYAPANLRSGVIIILFLLLRFFGPNTDYRDKGRGHDRRLRPCFFLFPLKVRVIGSLPRRRF